MKLPVSRWRPCRTLLLVATALSIFACGGESDSEDPGPAPNDPTVPTEPTPPEPEPEPEPDPSPTPTPEDNIQVLVNTNSQGTALPAQLQVMPGGSAEITLTPNADNEVKYVEGCPGNMSGNLFTVQPIDGDCSLYVEFGPIDNRLTIDVFGEGLVLQGDETVCSDRQTCTLNGNGTDDIQLSAQPSSGWRLDHWDGCDSTDGDNCFVTLDRDINVTPVFARDSEPVLNDDVIILTDEQLDSIEDIDEASLVFSVDTPQIEQFAIGNILVSTRDTGFARRITRVIALPQSPVLVQTRAATVTEVVQEGTLIWDGVLDADTSMEFEPAPGVTLLSSGPARALSRSVEIETVAYDADGNLATTGDQVKLSGGISATFTPDFALDRSFLDLEELRLAAGASIETSVTLSYSIPLPDALKAGTSIRLGTFVSPPIPVGPIVIAPRYEAFIDLATSVSAKVELTTSFQVAGTLGTHYRRADGRGFELLNSLSANASPPALDDLELSLNSNLWAGIDAKFLVYGVSGPFIKVGPRFGYQRSVALTGERAGCFEESAYFGATGEVGGTIDLLVWEIRTPTRTVNLKSIELSWQQDQQPRCDRGVYGPPQNLAASVNEDNTIALSWEPPAGIPLIKYSVFRDNAIVESVWGTEYIDATAPDASTSCYQVIGFDSNGRSSVPSETVCATTRPRVDSTPPTAPANLSIDNVTVASIELSWSESIDDSGAVAYLVENGGQVVERAVAGNATISQLLSNTEYCFQIVAVDAVGNRSTPSNTACATTLPEDAGLWRMRLACEGREYVLENNIDLQATTGGVVNFAGEGNDYDGTALAYIVSGIYDAPSQTLDGRITYTFADTTEVRIDEFFVDLSTGDTGDVPMNQVQVTGCETVIRLELVDTVLTKLTGESRLNGAWPAQTMLNMGY